MYGGWAWGNVGREFDLSNFVCTRHRVLIGKHHIHYFERFPISQFNDSLGRVDLNCIHRLGTSVKLEFSNGHNLLKFRPNSAYEVFFDIYRKRRCQM